MQFLRTSGAASAVLLALVVIAVGCGDSTTAQKSTATTAGDDRADSSEVSLDDITTPSKRPQRKKAEKSRAQAIVVLDPGEVRLDPDEPLPDFKSHRPTDAEVKAELRELEKHQAVVTNGNGGGELAIASVYTDYGLPLACPPWILRREMLGVAHKTLPCGTKITFTFRNRQITVEVIDRGPYIAGRTWDFTGATAAALKFPGLGVVRARRAGKNDPVSGGDF